MNSDRAGALNTTYKSTMSSLVEVGLLQLPIHDFTSQLVATARGQLSDKREVQVGHRHMTLVWLNYRLLVDAVERDTRFRRHIA